MWWIIIISFIVLAVIKVQFDKNKEEERGNQLSESMEETTDFNASVIVTGYQNRYSFSWDNTSRKILYIDNKRKVTIPFDEVISYEVKEDNTVIHSKSMLRTVGGGLIGGLVAGGVGALIGGLSGNQKQKQKISRIDIIIRIRDLNTPSLTVKCFDSITMTDQGAGGIKANNYIISLVKDDVNSICDILNVIIDENKQKYSLENQERTETNSTIKDLEKLVSLKEKGVLNDEEFQELKKKILSN